MKVKARKQRDEVTSKLSALYTENEALRTMMAQLAEALEEARLTLEVMQGRGSSVGLTLAIIDRALAAHRKQGGEV